MELTDEQRALRDAVRELLRRHPPGQADESRPGDKSGPANESSPADRSYPADRRGYDPKLWRLLCDIGVPGLAIPQRYGGAGAGPVETAIVAEELGRVLAPAPLLGSAVLAAQAILGSGDTDACDRLLPRIAEGAAIAALAWTGPSGGWDPAEAACHAAGRSGGAWTLTGAAHYVLDGDSADVLIVAARMPGRGVGLFEVDTDQPGVDKHAVTSMDQTRRLAVVRLTAAAGRPLGPAAASRPPGPGVAARPPGPAAPLGSAALARARDLACVALSAEQAGAAARALELTVGYTGTRVQFGRPIASFQAVQHRLADLHVLVASARSLSYQAAAAAAIGAPALPQQAAAAKAYCSEVLMRVAGEMIQLHGAIGITWEHDAHRYFKRAHAAAQLFGQPSAHIARIAACVIDE